MLALAENETVVIVIRKHWFVMLRTAVTAMILLLLPPVVLTFLPYAPFGLERLVTEHVVNFFLALYVMALILYLFLFWMDYFLDMWIVTNERIIDVVQQGLFNRTISEIPLSHVQDITIEIKGVVETFLKFGTLRIQTAGEREFLIEDAPRLYETKDAILTQIRRNQGFSAPRAENTEAAAPSDHL